MRLSSVAIDAADHITVAGPASLTAGDGDFLMIRLRSDGAFDSGFTGSGIRAVSFDHPRSLPATRQAR